MRTIRRNDQVLVVAGRERGKQGKVRQVLPQESRVVIEGINLVKRHLRRRPNLPQSGIVQREAPLSLANVRLLCPKCGKPTRVGVLVKESSAKIRMCKRCKQEIE